MAFDNVYPNRKDWRKPYRKRCEQQGRSHRPGGSCSYCQQNRQYRTDKRKPIIEKDGG